MYHLVLVATTEEILSIQCILPLYALHTRASIAISEVLCQECISGLPPKEFGTPSLADNVMNYFDAVDSRTDQQKSLKRHGRLKLSATKQETQFRNCYFRIRGSSSILVQQPIHQKTTSQVRAAEASRTYERVPTRFEP